MVKNKRPPLKIRKKLAYRYMAGFLFTLTLLLLLIPRKVYIPQEEESAPKAVYSTDDKTVVDHLPADRVQKDQSPLLILVIDDVGQSIEQTMPFLKIPGPVTFALLPGLIDSNESYRAILKAEKSVILHQPMEALGGNNPGPGAILLDHEEDKIVQTLLSNLKDFPEIKGINNHMGSKVTADLRIMEVVMKTLKHNKMFFLDSLTNGKSVAKEVATSLDLPFAERAVFLDNEQNKDYILNALEEARKEAREKGHAVMIGHIWTQELADIMIEVYPQLIEEGFSMGEIKDILMGAEEQ